MEKNDLLHIIETDKTFKKYGVHEHSVSGSCTIVYPISLWENEIEIQWTSCRKSTIQRFIDRIVKISNGLIKCGYYVKTDGTTNNTIKFLF